MPIIVITNREFAASEGFLRILIVSTMRKLISQLIMKLFGRRLLLPTFLSSGTEASGLINMLSLSRNLTESYLEIGVENGLTLESVRIKRKIGVDPFPQFLSTFLVEPKKAAVNSGLRDFCHLIFHLGRYLSRAHHLRLERSRLFCFHSTPIYFIQLPVLLLHLSLTTLG